MKVGVWRAAETLKFKMKVCDFLREKHELVGLHLVCYLNWLIAKFGGRLLQLLTERYWRRLEAQRTVSEAASRRKLRPKFCSILQLCSRFLYGHYYCCH
jgi:hypothetical protein